MVNIVIIYTYYVFDYISFNIFFASYQITFKAKLMSFISSSVTVSDYLAIDYFFKFKGARN